MQVILTQTTQLVGSYIPNLGGALAILIIGWLVAVIVSAIVPGALRRSTLGDRLARAIVGEEAAKAADVEQWFGKGVFYLIMVFVLVAFFQALGLTLITEPLNRFLSQLFQYLSQVLGAGLLVLLAWILATALRFIVSRVLNAVKIDERLGDQAGIEEEGRVPLSKSLADAVYWLVFLLFLPAILSALNLEGLLLPVQGMINELLGFLPNLLAAGLILLVGWLVGELTIQPNRGAQQHRQGDVSQYSNLLKPENLH